MDAGLNGDGAMNDCKGNPSKKKGGRSSVRHLVNWKKVLEVTHSSLLFQGAVACRNIN